MDGFRINTRLVRLKRCIRSIGLLDAEPTLNDHPPTASRALTLGVITSIVLFVALVWSFWPTLRGLLGDWRHDENYSVGQLVPLAALYLAWHDRTALRACRIGPCWWGVLIILAAQAGRAFGLWFVFESAERYALVLTLIGVVLLVAGWPVFWRSRWILLFLFLMIPLPGKIHNMISGPLQTLATSGPSSCSNW